VSEDEMANAVRRSVEGWNRDDFDACASIAHPDIEWTSAVAEQFTGRASYRGLKGLRRYWDEWHDIWRVRLSIRHMFHSGDTVVIVACTEARGDSSGVILRQLMGYVYEFEDGLARRVSSFIDPARALEAAGIPGLYSAVLPGR
jgi:ketosteroid isomerase-like protein